MLHAPVYDLPYGIFQMILVYGSMSYNRQGPLNRTKVPH